MSLYKELSYESAIAPVKSVQFALLSPDEIVKRSVCKITSSETFEGGVQKPNGMFDQRMGVVEHGKFCQTCSQGYTFCPGHHGHIELAVPVFHIHFFKTVVCILKCVCFRCSRLLIDPNEPEMVALRKLHRQKRWEAVYKLISKNGTIKRCGQHNPHGCGAIQPTRTAKHDEKFLKVEHEMSWDGIEGENKPSKITLGAEDVLRILSRIPDEDIIALGFHPKYSRPEWMIATVLPIPPPAVRPSAKNEMGQRSEDDLTIVLINIVKINTSLLQKKTAGKSIDSEPQVQLLQYYVATMVDNQIPNTSPATQRTGRSIKSISERLKTKEGRVRGNLLGKRVDYSARSVITPDPNISINELGVPLRVAMNLTFPEMVNHHNRSRLIDAVKNGPTIYPGARFIQKSGGDTQMLRLNKESPEIAIGDIVHRHLRDGDYVLFNRQPSLHKMSMMAHRVRVMPYNTFRLNACVTPSFNADFDGDEMNLHATISAFTMTEISMLAAVPMHVLTPKNSSPIIAVVQDVALGVHLITLPDVHMNNRLMYNLLASIPRFNGIVPDANKESIYWTGKQALSMIIPSPVNVSMKSSTDHPINIKHGIISESSDALDTSTYQKKTVGLVHTVYNEHGPRALTDMLDGTQRMVCDWLMQTGFSVGLSDLVVDPDVMEEIENGLGETSKKVNDIIKVIHGKNWKPKVSLNTPDEDFEKNVNEILNAAREKAASTATKKVDASNRIKRMITAGSKGKDLNLVQMTATLGQQSVDQKRPGYGFEGRTLPHYTKYDDGAEARGFVNSSFARGLKPSEFLFHSMGGRVGLIDTAVRTSESGYISRKLVKAMEDCKIATDGTVRNALGQIVQVLYGEDGMDAVSIELQKLFHLDFDGQRMADEFLIAENEIPDGWLTEDAKKKWLDNPEWSRFNKHFYDIMEDRRIIVMFMYGGKKDIEKDKTVEFPVNLHRIINDALEYQRLDKPRGWPSDLDPRYVLDTIDELVDTLVAHPYIGQAPVFTTLLRSYLNPKRLLNEGMFLSTFDNVINIIKERFDDSVSQPGDMVGIVSAQSLGEPTTQLTLNTFHMAGVASGSKAVSGLPRVMELLNVTSNPKQSLIHAYLPEDLRFDHEAAAQLKPRLETTYLSDVVTKSKIYYDPDTWNTRVAEDQELIEAYSIFSDPDADFSNSPWVIRLQLDKETMLTHALTMLDISDAINNFYRESVSTMHSDDNSNELIFRIRLIPQSNSATNDLLTEVKAFEAAMMESVALKGNIGIKTAMPLKLRGAREYEYDAAIGSFTKVSEDHEWILECDGKDLAEVLASPLIDPKRTQSNDVCETLNVLGVEAARQKLYEELQIVLADSKINPRHILLLVDTMTLGGGLQSINRHGINRGDIGPLAKCSFEETTDMLRNAAMFAEIDKVNGVSASIMLGQVPPGGTGDVDPVLDETLVSDTILVDHPLPTDEDYSKIDRDEMCRRILRFAPIDMDANDGWSTEINIAVNIKK
ncbi:DNA-directed RNA polymerase II subunit Rpb1 [Tetraselmis virus 1]|uniref:DNA-directed RNA polymerase subunit n=1 Tax=Tetraselmis virus 1 TaxID=2060617 RepID=A0A2P0VP07_9VIRU|nr:DNA-directed RNA polymerase II subunit Rpb1 [Tetraselmis virus 1]AUF82600.1 DNA-directed RNA polymerase II subunit Rpb1 [Tetraselmis virus 1]